MPTSVVDINLSAETGATAQPTYNEVAVIGTASSEPDGGFNQPERYSSASDVAEDFGDGSDVHVASQQLAQMGTSDWLVIVGEEVSHTETVAGADASESYGVVEDTPILGDRDSLTVTVDGTEHSVRYVTETALDNYSGDIAADEAVVNASEGEIAIGESTSGADSGIVVEYSSIDWTTIGSKLNHEQVDLVFMGDRHFGREGIGDLDELVGWASQNTRSVVAAARSGNEYASEREAREAATDVAAYVPSRDLMFVAHKSPDDVAATIMGQLAVEDPWFDPFWDGDSYPITTEYYDRSQIGDPGTPGTFEGGNDEQVGSVNVIINVGGSVVLSNSLTTAGASSNYQYFDVGRTEAFISNEAKEALESLRLAADQIPFTPSGRNRVLGEIRARLQQYTSGSGSPLSEVKVTSPNMDQISDQDKANRVFPGITINGTLAGNVHTFGVNLNIRV